MHIFVSSSFSDMRHERERLMTIVFPRLRRIVNTLGIDLIEIDLRWGITEEQSNNAEALYRCLKEIDRCRDSPVFFLGLLGNHYGQLPTQDALDKTAALLKCPRITQWSGKSYTEIEMQYAVLTAGQESQLSSLFLTRSNDLTIRLAPAHNVMVDPQNRLRAQVQKQAINVRDYNSLEQMSQFVERFILERLQVSIKHDVTELISKPYETEGLTPKHHFASVEKTSSNQENDLTDIHSRRSIAKRRFFDSSSYSKTLLDQVRNASPLVVVGPSGSGKSTFISNYIHGRLNSDVKASCFEFFCDSQSNSDFEDLVDRLCASAGVEAAKTGVAKSRDIHSPRDRLMECIESIANGVQLKIAIYNSQYLSSPWNSLSWLPDRLPDNVQLFISTSKHPDKSLKILSFDVWNDIGNRRNLVRSALSWFGKSVTDTQLEQLVSENHKASPLLLTHFVNELRFVSNRGLVDATIARLRQTHDATDVHEQLLERIESYFGFELSKNAMSFLTASHLGLEDSELAKLCRSSNAIIESLLGQLADKVELLNGVNRLTSDQFEEAIRRRYFSDGDNERAIRMQIRQAFSERINFPRWVLEVVHQTSKLELHDELRKQLLDPLVLLQLMKSKPSEIKTYWQTLGVPYYMIGEQYKPIIKKLMRFRIDGLQKDQIGEFTYEFCKLLAAFDSYNLLKPLARRWHMLGNLGCCLSNVPVLRRYVKQKPVLAIRGNMAFRLADVAEHEEQIGRSLKLRKAGGADLFRVWESELTDQLGDFAPVFLLAGINYQNSLFNEKRGKGHTLKALNSARAASDIYVCVPSDAIARIKICSGVLNSLWDNLLKQISKLVQSQIQVDELLQPEELVTKAGRIKLPPSAFCNFRSLIPNVLIEHSQLHQLHLQVKAMSRYLIDVARLELGDDHLRTSALKSDQRFFEWMLGEISDEEFEESMSKDKNRIIEKSGKKNSRYVQFLLDYVGLCPMLGKNAEAQEMALEARAIAEEIGISREIRRSNEQLDTLAFFSGEYEKLSNIKSTSLTPSGVRSIRFVVSWIKTIEFLSKLTDKLLESVPSSFRPLLTSTFNCVSKSIDFLTYPLIVFFSIGVFVSAPGLLTLPGHFLYSLQYPSTKIPLPIWGLAFGFCRGMIIPRNYPGDNLIEKVMPRIGIGILYGIFGIAIGYLLSGWIPSIGSLSIGFLLGLPAFAMLDITVALFYRVLSKRQTSKLASLVLSTDAKVTEQPTDKTKAFGLIASYLFLLEKANHVPRSEDLRGVILPRIAYLWRRLGRIHQFENVLDYLVRFSSLHVRRWHSVVLLSQNIDRYIEEIKKTDPEFCSEQDPDFIVLEAVSDYRKGDIEKALSAFYKALSLYGLDLASTGPANKNQIVEYDGRLVKFAATLGFITGIVFWSIKKLLGVVTFGKPLNLSDVAMVYCRSIQIRRNENHCHVLDQKIKNHVEKLIAGKHWPRLYLLQQIREIDAIEIPEVASDLC
jgi:hypothetical protein